MFESDKAYIFTEDELVDLCREWQERLRLEHWDIALRIARACDFTNEGDAEITWVLSKAKAIMKILDPVDYPAGPFKQDMEISLVHELLHLHFAPFDHSTDGSMENTMMERATDHIAITLVNLKRNTA